MPSESFPFSISLVRPRADSASWVDACEDARLKQPPKERYVNSSIPRGSGITGFTDTWTRPRRNPDTLTNHGFAGGAKMQMKSNERDGEADAEGENDDLDSLDGRPAKRADTRQERDPGDDDEEDDLDGPEERERAETRKKARANYSDEEDE